MKIEVEELATKILVALDTDCLVAHSTPSDPTPPSTMRACQNTIELAIRRYLADLVEA